MRTRSAQGLYGPFLVLEPGEPWDPETDGTFLLGSLGTGEDPPAAVNGRLQPEPIQLRTGEAHRLPPPGHWEKSDE